MKKNITKKIAAIALAITSVTTTVMMPASADWSTTPFTFTNYTYQDYQKSIGGPTLTSSSNNNYGARFKNYTKTPYQYNSLTKQEQTLYKNIMKHINAGKTEIKIAEGVTKNQLRNVMEVISEDGCEATLEYYEDTRTLKVPEYKPSEFFIEFAEEIEDKFPKKASDYDKIKVIHDEICRRYKYGFDRTKAPIVSEYIVCSGYSGLFKDLCKYFNINCIEICSESHAWNKVEIDGNWYNVDVCWDDGSKIRHSYFLISDSKLAKLDSSKSHKALSSDGVPKCPKSYSR